MANKAKKLEQQEETRSTAVVEVGTTAAAMRDSEDALEILNRRNELFEQVLAVAMKATKASDWKDFGGKPYLESTGCEKVALRFGISTKQPRYDPPNGEEFEDSKGKYYVYTCWMTIVFGKQEFDAMGTCSSRDKFFGQTSGGGYKPLADVDRPNIKKKAYTNAFQNGIKRALGLRGLSWEDLEAYKITKAGKGSVSFKKKGEEVKAEGPRKPFWTSEWKGKTFLWAKVGEHFTEAMLKKLGFKLNEKGTAYFADHTTELENHLLDAFESAEAGGAK